MPIYNSSTYTRIVRPLPRYVKKDIYSIPFIEIDSVDIHDLNNGKWLINMKNVSSKDKKAKYKIVQSFCYDDVLIREYNNPYKYLRKVKDYYAVSTFDFSVDTKMDFPIILNATYCNRWIGAFLQSYGMKVVPTVGWTDKKYYDVCFAGLRDGGVFIISTLGANNDRSYNEYIDGYKELRKRFPNTKIISVGDKIVGMDDDVCYIKYKDSFGYYNENNPYWQMKFINWDGSINERIYQKEEA